MQVCKIDEAGGGGAWQKEELGPGFTRFTGVQASNPALRSYHPDPASPPQLSIIRILTLLACLLVGRAEPALPL